MPCTSRIGVPAASTSPISSPRWIGDSSARSRGWCRRAPFRRAHPAGRAQRGPRPRPPRRRRRAGRSGTAGARRPGAHSLLPCSIRLRTGCPFASKSSARKRGAGRTVTPALPRPGQRHATERVRLRFAPFPRERGARSRTWPAPIRVVVAKPGLDGHDRGAKVVARALRDAGMEVIYTGLHQTPEQIVETAIQEDADAVGLSVLSGAHMTLFAQGDRAARASAARDDIVVFGGGIIPEADMPELERARRREDLHPRCDDHRHHRLGARQPRRAARRPDQPVSLGRRVAGRRAPGGSGRRVGGLVAW